MQILCPYCHSENVKRMFHQPSPQANANTGLLGASATFAGIGASLSRSLPKQIPISPWAGGIAGAVIGGLLSSLLEPPAQPAPVMVSYFFCQQCQQAFQ